MRVLATALLALVALAGCSEVYASAASQQPVLAASYDLPGNAATAPEPEALRVAEAVPTATRACSSVMMTNQGPACAGTAVMKIAYYQRE